MPKELTEEQKEKKRLNNRLLYQRKKEQLVKEKREYRKNNKEEIAKRRKLKYDTNKEEISLNKKEKWKLNKEELNKKRREKFNNLSEEEKILFREERRKNYSLNKDKINERSRNYSKNNRDKLNLYQKNKYYNNPLFRLKHNIRRAIHRSLNSNNFTKKSRTHEILGCSFEDFKIHLENQFESWMNWENYGNPKDRKFEPNKTWDIDHIIPISIVNTEQEILKLNHYTNLQPLCSFVNRWVKSDNY